jgi:hypothetical protein
LYGPRSRLQMLQMSLASWRWVSVFIQSFRLLYFSGSLRDIEASLLANAIPASIRTATASCTT